MPELPEIETIKRALASSLCDAVIQNIVVRFHRLRWPIPSALNERFGHQTIQTILRRGKYLLIQTTGGCLIIHLGMSGSLHLLSKNRPLRPHDHVDILFNSGQILRYNDPRRFGAILWANDPLEHPLLASLGIEPLDPTFTKTHLKSSLANHHAPIKSVLMNGKIIAGLGNIYAAEALFSAGIHPKTPANQLNEERCERLVHAIKTVLERAIKAGGTSIKDYVNSEGKPGYFSQQLAVYGRENLPCTRCEQPLQSLQLGQRCTVFCSVCQL